MSNFEPYRYTPAETHRYYVNAAKGLHSAPYDDALAKAQATNVAKPDTKRQRAKRLAGVTRWQNGMPTLVYVKDGITGITSTYDASRAKRRASDSEYRHKRHTRAHEKHKARLSFLAARYAQTFGPRLVGSDAKVSWLNGWLSRWKGTAVES